MSYGSINPQECFFYEGKWNEKSVNAFINLLLDEKKEGCWEVNGDNEPSLLTALEFLNLMLDTNFVWDDIIAQHNMLKKRYLTFKAVLDVEGVNWDQVINHVYAFSHVWIELIKANEFAKAFYHKGDIMHHKLAALFGCDHDISNAIIQISSGEQNPVVPNTAIYPISIEDSDDEQEVDSPNMVGRKPPRKRLFHEPGADQTRALVSAESHTKIVSEATTKRMSRRPIISKMNTLSPHSPRTIPLLLSKKAGSSSASSSPLKWIYSPQEKK